MTQKNKKWELLEPGDIVEVVAPASSSLAKDYHNALRFVHKFGLTPRSPKKIFGKDPLCSNSDQQRFRFLKKAIENRDSKAIWCLRGGYGSLRLLPFLARMPKPKHCKLFIGYSDNTALHCFFNQQWGWPTLHGSMLEELGRGEGGRGELWDFYSTLYGYEKELYFDRLAPMNSAARQKKQISGRIAGGNLAILTATLGTPWSFSARGKILVLEDIGERGYRVDRMLVHLEQAGALKGVKAVIFGDFVGGEENRDDDCVYLWRDVQEKFARDHKFPVLKGLPFGHGAFQRPVPFLTSAKLQLGRAPSLTVKVR